MPKNFTWNTLSRVRSRDKCPKWARLNFELEISGSAHLEAYDQEILKMPTNITRNTLSRARSRDINTKKSDILPKPKTLGRVDRHEVSVFMYIY